jgi:peptidyl-prolyl cis-trans isomerase C
LTRPFYFHIDSNETQKNGNTSRYSNVTRQKYLKHIGIGGCLMVRIDRKYFMTLFVLVSIILLAGCNSGADKKPKESSQAAKELTSQPSIPSSGSQNNGAAIVVDVDGSKLTQADVDSEINKNIAAIKDQIPKEKMGEAKAELKKRVVEDFTVKTLLVNEVTRLKIDATDKEVSDALEGLKKSLPKGTTIEEVMKKNNLTKDKMYDDIRLGVKINKLLLAQKGSNSKPTEKEISNFYEKNKNKFVVPESVHARHILIAKSPKDDEKIKAEKLGKIENLRKQLIAGSDFAELAKKNSDCPSKNNGGDLGTFRRGEMVKPFEEAAFSQEKNVIGPVVETDFGYHIIQVLDRIAQKNLILDDALKARIAAFLQQQKKQEIFDALLKNLRTKAKIVIS